MSEAESYGEEASHWNEVAILLSGMPLGHFADYSHRFAIKLAIDSAHHRYVAHRAVGIDDEAAKHATLNLLPVSLVGIFASLVDEIGEGAVAARELGLHVDLVELVDHLTVRRLCSRHWVAIVHPLHLRNGRH